MLQQRRAHLSGAKHSEPRTEDNGCLWEKKCLWKEKMYIRKEWRWAGIWTNHSQDWNPHPRLASLPNKSQLHICLEITTNSFLCNKYFSSQTYLYSIHRSYTHNSEQWNWREFIFPSYNPTDTVSVFLPRFNKCTLIYWLVYFVSLLCCHAVIQPFFFPQMLWKSQVWRI